MCGRHAALAILTLTGGIAGGIYFERVYLSPPDAAASDGPEVRY
jgi:Cu(I)/Ag(I) efflux system membrane fusion protein